MRQTAVCVTAKRFSNLEKYKRLPAYVHPTDMFVPVLIIRVSDAKELKGGHMHRRRNLYQLWYVATMSSFESIRLGIKISSKYIERLRHGKNVNTVQPIKQNKKY